MSENTLGISSIGPYWNLKSANYFKREHSFFVIFFIKTISGNRRFFFKIKNNNKKNQRIRLVKVLILPNIMLW